MHERALQPVGVEVSGLEREATSAFYHGYVDRDVTRVESAYERMLAIDSVDQIAIHNLSMLYTATGRCARAEQLVRRGIAAGLQLLGRRTPVEQRVRVAQRAGGALELDQVDPDYALHAGELGHCLPFRHLPHDECREVLGRSGLPIRKAAA